MNKNEKIYTVYELTEKDELGNEITFWYGSTSNIERRYSQHKSEAKLRYNKNVVKEEATRRAMENGTLKINILATIVGKKDAEALENFFIKNSIEHGSQLANIVSNNERKRNGNGYLNSGKRIKITAIDRSGNKQYFNSVVEASKALNVNSVWVSQCKDSDKHRCGALIINDGDIHGEYKIVSGWDIDEK